MENHEMNNQVNNKPCTIKILAIIAIILSIISITMSAFTIGLTLNSGNRHRNRFTTSTSQDRNKQNNDAKCPNNMRDQNGNCPNNRQGRNDNCPSNMNNRYNPSDFYNFFRNMPGFNDNDGNRPNMHRFNRPNDSGTSDRIGNEPPKVENEVKAPQ